VPRALAAGLAAYSGNALVNSVTGEDSRLEAVLPLVARHSAAGRPPALAHDSKFLGIAAGQISARPAVTASAA